MDFRSASELIDLSRFGLPRKITGFHAEATATAREGSAPSPIERRDGLVAPTELVALMIERRKTAKVGARPDCRWLDDGTILGRAEPSFRLIRLLDNGKKQQGTV